MARLFEWGALALSRRPGIREWPTYSRVRGQARRNPILLLLLLIGRAEAIGVVIVPRVVLTARAFNMNLHAANGLCESGYAKEKLP
jgi:hypothetical protein